jgi:hypothetical protein
MTVQRIQEIDTAYAYCVEHDQWPEGFNPFNAIRDLLRETNGYMRALSEHHNIANLSQAAIRESIGGTCQICAKAQRRP